MSVLRCEKCGRHVDTDFHEMYDGECELCATEFEPYDVTCARCGKVLSCNDAIPEEGDEWECGPCWDRCNAEEQLQQQAAQAAEDSNERRS